MPSALEFDFVDPDSVLVVELDFKFADVICVDSCVAEYDSSYFILRKELAARLLGGLCGGSGSTGSCGRIIVDFGFNSDYCAGYGIDHIIIFDIAGLEIDFVDPDSVLIVKLDFKFADVICVDSDRKSVV